MSVAVSVISEAAPARASAPPAGARTVYARHPAVDNCLGLSHLAAGEPGISGRYERLFPALAPLEAGQSDLITLGEAGGPCDGTAISREGSSAAGWPFFGQFVAHDITADRSAAPTDGSLDALRAVGAPRANLDGIYGAGPARSPFLYQREDPAKLLLGRTDIGLATDLPRNGEGIALIGDPRNDANLFVSQLHLALLGVHNRFIDRLRAEGTPEPELFDAAARATRWHYQWILANEYLPLVAGKRIVRDVVANGPRLYLRDSIPAIPLEFEAGALRCAHGQIRDTYAVRRSAVVPLAVSELVGFRPVARTRAVDWSLMFDTAGGRRAQRARRIDGRLAGALMRVPGGEPSLASQHLGRGIAVGLPSGEDVALAAGELPIPAEQLGLGDSGWSGHTPLWLYLMCEAAVHGNGNRLGPVGGRIVTEVAARDPRRRSRLVPLLATRVETDAPLARTVRDRRPAGVRRGRLTALAVGGVRRRAEVCRIRTTSWTLPSHSPS